MPGLDRCANFDRLAKPYRWLEYLTFGPFLELARSRFMAEFAYCRNALVLGDGDGRFTAQLLRTHSKVRVHAVDASSQMLEELLSRAGSGVSRVTTERADLRVWQPETSIRYDLIATHFFLDCLTTGQIADLARRLQTVATQNTIWVVSDFSVPGNRFGKLLAAPLVAGLYRAFGLLTGLRLTALPNHEQALSHNGWRLVAQRLHLHGLLISQLWRHHPAQDH